MDRGISLDELASEVQISQRTLAEVMAGEGGLTFGQLQKLAKYFNRGVLFFLESGAPDGSRIYSPQFRTLENQKPHLTPRVRALIERVERQRNIYLSLLEELGEGEAASFTAPDINREDIPAAAEQTRVWLGLGERNQFTDYRRAVEATGILVFRTNGYNGPWQIPKDDSVEGFCLYDAACPVIVVKKQDSEARQSFTLFHELAHILLHRASFIDEDGELSRNDGQERQANDFAGRLLVPTRFLGEIAPQRPISVEQFDDWLRPYRSAWGVSAEVILRRMLEEGRLDRADYASYRAWRANQAVVASPGGTRQYRHREPIHVFGQMFAKTVIEALNRDAITSNKASTYLDNLKLKDLRRLEEYLATH